MNELTTLGEKPKLNWTINTVSMEINGKMEPMVNARELHAVLESKKRFSDWIKAKLKATNASKGLNYLVNHQTVNNPDGGRPPIEYYLTRRISEKIAMLENTPRGDEVRDYFADSRDRGEIVEALLIEQQKQIAQIAQTAQIDLDLLANKVADALAMRLSIPTIANNQGRLPRHTGSHLDEVLEMVNKGMWVDEIARARHVQPGTVIKHLLELKKQRKLPQELLKKHRLNHTHGQSVRMVYDLLSAYQYNPYDVCKHLKHKLRVDQVDYIRLVYSRQLSPDQIANNHLTVIKGRLK